MNKIEEAIIYATVMHQGKVRKLGNIPYIPHPLEVAQILSTIRTSPAFACAMRTKTARSSTWT